MPKIDITKKKTAVQRKKVLSLQTPNDNRSSPPRSLWQAKYEALLPSENDDSNSNSSCRLNSSSKSATGLVGDYNSDSDSDLEAHKNTGSMATTSVATASKTVSQQVLGTSWIQCYDQSTGYPYYWNQITNEVSWQAPPEFIAALQQVQSRVATTLKQPAEDSLQKPKKRAKLNLTKYPWQKSSDDDEKIEMITSFGPQSDEESGIKSTAATRKHKIRHKLKKEDLSVVGPQLPHGIEEHNDTYETSSLMTPLVADVGPPGVEAPSINISNSPDCYNRIQAISTIGTDTSNSSVDENCDSLDVINKLKNKAKLLRDSPEQEITNTEVATVDSIIDRSDLADEILAAIEMEEPPDLATENQRIAITNPPTTSFALIASYGDDSDADDISEPVIVNSSVASKRPGSSIAIKESMPLFPSATEENSTVKIPSKPLFPVIDVDSLTCENESKMLPTSISIEDVSNETPSAVRTPLSQDVDSTPNVTPSAVRTPFSLDVESTTSKAFQRKKRIEITKEPSSDCQTEYSRNSRFESGDETQLPPVVNGTCRYNIDPDGGERRGFGFSQTKTADSKRTSSIHFVKSETINFQHSRASSPSINSSTTGNSMGSSMISSQDLTDGATLLKEKLAFLGEGKEEVSAIQLMAIQLETLFLAWQSGSLTPEYMSQWLGSRAIELSKNEQAASPAGWTCEWDRAKKRYSYRNQSTAEVIWEYPDAAINSANADQAGGDQVHPSDVEAEVAIEEVEMEISYTPPRLSPTPPGNDPVGQADASPPPPPPPAPKISRIATPPPPSPPAICDSTSHVDNLSAAYRDGRFAGPPLPADNYPPLPRDEPLPPGVDDLDFPSCRTRPQLPSSIWIPPPPPPPPDSTCQPYDFQTSSTVSGPSIKLQDKKKSLVSELDSFYSDLAKLNENDAIETTASDIRDPISVQMSHTVPINSTKTPELTKKKKKNKITPGLTLKKKGVSSLVAKWQQVREEATKNNSDDETASS